MRCMRFALVAAAALALLSTACAGGDESGGTRDSSTAGATSPTLAETRPTASPTPIATSVPPTVAVTATPTATPPPVTATPAPPTATRAAQPAPTQSAPVVSAITVKAENLMFDRSVIRVRAGTQFTATLQNNDAGVDHNLTFSLPGLGHPTCTGPCTTTQTLTPTTPGTYSFFCTLHGAMFGDFIVE